MRLPPHFSGKKPHKVFNEAFALKILQRVNRGTGSKFGTDIAKRYGEGSSDSVKRHLSQMPPSCLNCLLNFLFKAGGGGVHLRKGNSLSLKRHLFPHGDRVKMLAQGFLDLFFDAAPYLEYFYPIFRAQH